MVSPPEERLSPLPLVAALALFVAHAALFGGWIVDDAGITFAYARNLAAGYGVVAQPGVPPVEGYSNPTWMLVAALGYALRIFVLPWAPKVLAGLCAAGTFVLVWRDLGRRGASAWTTGVALVLLAACSGFVIWVVSGLENALLAWLAAVSASLALGAADDAVERPRRDLAAGVVAALLALTRPDAVLYAIGYPAALAVAAFDRPRRLAPVLRGTARTLAGFLPVFGGYLAFRFLYFGDWVPNTFHAKVKPAGASLFDPGKLLDLVEGAVGDALFPVLLLLVAAAGALVWRRALRPRTVVLGGYLAIAIGIYMLMPVDWMGEFRFATPFFLFFYWSGAELATALAAAMPPTARLRTAAAVATAVFLAQAGIIFAARSLRFAEDPTVPLTVAARFGGQGFNRLAAALPDRRVSLLTPDLGGVLLTSETRVYDLAGLCDPVIARTLHERPQALREYVLGEVRPTFVHTQGAFTRSSALHLDPRFTRDYAALHEAWSTEPEWTRTWRGAEVPPFWGDYVRRDAVRAPGALASLQDLYRQEGLAAYRPWVRPPDRLRAGWPQVRWALARLGGGAGVPVAPAPAPAAVP